MARVVVVGAGVAGSRCAQRLAAQGHRVQVVDKARGPGGRLATRRLSLDGREFLLDHGAPSFVAEPPSSGWPEGFDAEFLARGRADGWLRDATPRFPDGRRGPPAWRVAPPQPQACRALLGSVDVAYSHTLHGLVRTADGWTLNWAEPERPAWSGVHALLLALPPAQAAAQLAPVHPAWAAAAAAVPMQPTWTWMAVSDALAGDWDALAPADATLATVRRLEQRASPPVTDRALWVAHASAAWSQAHLEDDPAAVQAQLEAAWRAALRAAGQTVPALHHALVHRWRYAQATAPSALPAWWDASLGLGVSGDWLGGGGIAGAWASGSALAAALGRG